LASNWSAGIEYLHADFGRPSALNAFGSTLGITPDVSADVVQAKLNLHFLKKRSHRFGPLGAIPAGLAYQAIAAYYYRGVLPKGIFKMFTKRELAFGCTGIAVGIRHCWDCGVRYESCAEDRGRSKPNKGPDIGKSLWRTVEL
jgi:hypothetical protein